jgi:hypothetical protein
LDRSALTELLTSNILIVCSLTVFLFQQHTAVPQTPLLTTMILKEQNEQWPEVQQEMTNALNEMRVNDQNFTVKNPLSSNSKLAKKRRNKAAGGDPGMAPIVESSMSTE